MKKPWIKRPPGNNNKMIHWRRLLLTVTLNEGEETIIGTKMKNLWSTRWQVVFLRKNRVRWSNVIIAQEDRQENFLWKVLRKTKKLRLEEFQILWRCRVHASWPNRPNHEFESKFMPSDLTEEEEKKTTKKKIWEMSMKKYLDR